MDKKWIIIANPTSGGGRGRKVAEAAEKLIRAGGVETEFVFTKAKGDAAMAAKKAVDDQISGVIACGGDGTVHEVINSLATSQVVFGLIPCGRGNDFARAMNIPTSYKKATEILLEGRTKRIDLGIVEGHYFATVVTLGFDSEVARLVFEKAVPFTGTAAYILGVIKMFRSYKGINLRMTGDFGSVDQPVLLTATGNTSSYGGGIKIVPDASPTDGLLDVCHARMMSRSKILRLLPTAFWGGHTSNEHISMFQTRTLKLDTDVPVVLFADGEPVCETPATISVVRQALTVVCP